MIGKLEMFCFQNNLNLNKFPPLARYVLNSTQRSSLADLTRFV